ncbi:MAG: DUF393 domain-containing protein [Abitibacteriaceae bacterium]|nr:DUF393 domain-containing protein [Abditibacteriaceae bacterium]
MRAIKHLILWDGECGFCRRVIHWVLHRDKKQRFEALAYQEAPSPPMTPELAAACAQAVHVIKTDGIILRAGRATLFILEQLGWVPLARLLLCPPLIWLVELGYRLIANHRMFFSRFFFRSE